MKYKANIKFSISSVIEYILLIYIIIVSSSVYNHSTDFKLYGSEFVMVFSSILILIKILKYKKRSVIIRKLIKAILLMGIFVLIYILMCNYRYSFEELLMIIFKFIFFIPIMYTYFIGEFLYGNRELELLNKFSKLITILSVISITFWLFGSVLKLINSTNTIYLSWGNGRTILSYYNIYFETQKTTVGTLSFIRNSSIFTEAPMYSLLIIIALLYELYLSYNIKMKRIFILVVACLSSFSATGICLASIFIYIKLIFSRKNNKIIDLLLKFLTPILFICVILILKNMINVKSGTGSAFCRLDDYIASIKAWKDNILFGNGINNTLCIINYMNPERMSNLGLSNSLGVVLAQGGMYITAIYIYPCINIILKSIIQKRYNIVFFIFGLIILFILTIFMYNFILLLLISLAYSYIGILRLKEKGDGKRHEI
nr:hypothetical protein DRB99_01700 [Clostridium butyricum]